MTHLIFSLETFINETLLGQPRRWLVKTIQPRLRLLITLGVILLSVVLPLQTSPRQLMLLLGLIPATIATLIFIRWPPVGLVGLVGALVIPYSGPSGLNMTMLLTGLLLGLWLLDMMVLRRDIYLVASRPVGPLLALVFVAVLAFGVGQLPWFLHARHAPLGAQLGGLALFILSAGAFLLVAHQIRELRWLEWMTWLLILLGGMAIVGSMLPGLNRLTAVLFSSGATGSMLWTWFIALAFSQVLLNRHLAPRWRWGLGLLVSVALYQLTIRGWDWKSGYVPPLISIVVIIGIRSWRLGLLFALGGLFLVPEIVSSLIETDQYSYGTRLDAWLIVLEIATANPILGLGPANYSWYTPLFSLRGYFIQFNSHSQYIDLIAQTGVLGLVCYLWIFGSVGRLGWSLRERVPEGFTRAYVYGALGGLVGTLAAGVLGDWVIPYFYNITLMGFQSSVLPWLFLGGLVALEQIALGIETGAGLADKPSF